jgi:hypothetical protein
MKTTKGLIFIIFGLVAIVAFLRAGNPGDPGYMTAANMDYQNSSAYSAPNGTNSLDLKGLAYQDIILTNQTRLVSSNAPSAGTVRSVTLRLIGSGTSTQNVIFPGWIYKNCALTNGVPTNGVSVLSVTYFGPDDTNAVAVLMPLTR